MARQLVQVYKSINVTGISQPFAAKRASTVL